MRRILISVALALFVLAFSGSAGAVTREFTDPVEGYANAFDITKITLSDPPGNFFIDVRVANFPGITTGDRLDVYLNTDRNLGTGCPSNFTCYGADYAVIIQDSINNCGVYHWGSSQWNLVQNLAPCSFNNGPTYSFSRGAVGNPAAFDVWAASYFGAESDRAPDSGSGLFDYTPPDTTITSGPSGATRDRNASFGFTSTEAGSSFGCSLDGSAFIACGSGASYAGLGDGSHTFQVRATDSAGNTDPSAATRAWSIDATPPTARAQTGTCCKANGNAVLEYQIADNSGVAASSVSIYRLGSGRPAKVCSFGADSVPRNYAAPCKVPASARGWLRFCARATDAVGGQSAPSCKRIRFGRLGAADATAGFAGAGNGAIRITFFRVTGLGGGKASIRCRGCRLRGRSAAGVILKPGASIEVRVVKPRIRGGYIRIRNVGGNLRKSKACLPPGLSGPVVSCSRTS